MAIKLSREQLISIDIYINGKKKKLKKIPSIRTIKKQLNRKKRKNQIHFKQKKWLKNYGIKYIPDEEMQETGYCPYG